jgi:hypothetical protein
VGFIVIKTMNIKGILPEKVMSIYNAKLSSGRFPGVTYLESPMDICKTLFAQVVNFLPWSTFTWARNDEAATVTSNRPPVDRFCVMAFAQLTYSKSQRNIEVCLSAQTAKFYHLGFQHGRLKPSMKSGQDHPQLLLRLDFPAE